MPGLFCNLGRKTRVIVTVLLLVLACPGPARATDDDASEASQRALGHGHEALKAFERGDHETALESFALAEAETHSPVFVLYMARSHAALGQLLRARELFAEVARETLPENAPETWVLAQTSAREALETMDDRVPFLIVLIEGPHSPPYELEVGPYRAHIEDRRHRLDLDPGSYELVVQNADGTRVAHSITLREGQGEHEVVISFPESKPKPKPKPKRTAPSARQNPVAPSEPEREPDNLAAFAALGIGIAASAVGLAAGTVAWVEARDVKSKCDGRSCPTHLEDDARSARGWANVATVGLAVGVVGLGSGFLLWDASAPTAGATRGPGVFVSGTF